VKLIEQRFGPSLTDRTAKIGGFAADLLLYSVQGSDAGEGFGGGGRCVDQMNVVELAPCMCPARNFIDGAVAIARSVNDPSRLMAADPPRKRSARTTTRPNHEE